MQRIETNDTRLLNAVFRSGYIYTVHHVSSHDGKRTEVAWYQIAPAKSTPVQQGRVRSASFSYYYPSIAVNAMRSIVVGFSGSSPTHYASAYFTGRTSSDPVGTMRAVALLKAGVAPYLENRWGDFSATVVDTDEASFWTVQEYTYRRSLWGTWWGKLKFSASGGSSLRTTTGARKDAGQQKFSRPLLNPKLRLGLHPQRTKTNKIAGLR